MIVAITVCRVRSFAAAVALCAIGTACSKGATPPPGSEPAVAGADAPVVKLLKDGAPIADFTVTDLDGRQISSASLRGKVVLVNFWATWCPPCRAEIPDLVALQQKYREHLVIVGIAEDEGSVDGVKH